MGKRQYSDEDKAAALTLLAANDGNILHTSATLNIPASTLRSWRDGEGINESVTKIRDIKKGELSDVYELVTRTYLARALDPEAVEETRGKDAVITAATATDKMQLLRNKPTEIIDDAGLTDEARANRIAALLDEARARRVGPPPVAAAAQQVATD